eukprot:3872694-Pyramimonas_sp.AAC.1
MSDVFAGIISDQGYGYHEEAGWQHCNPTHPIHILQLDTNDNRIPEEDVYVQDVYIPFWANHNRWVLHTLLFRVSAHTRASGLLKTADTVHAVVIKPNIGPHDFSLICIVWPARDPFTWFY